MAIHSIISVFFLCMTFICQRHWCCWWLFVFSLSFNIFPKSYIHIWLLAISCAILAKFISIFIYLLLLLFFLSLNKWVMSFQLIRIFRVDKYFPMRKSEKEKRECFQNGMPKNVNVISLIWLLMRCVVGRYGMDFMRHFIQISFSVTFFFMLKLACLPALNRIRMRCFFLCVLFHCYPFLSALQFTEFRANRICFG